MGDDATHIEVPPNFREVAQQSLHEAEGTGIILPWADFVGTPTWPRRIVGQLIYCDRLADAVHVVARNSRVFIGIPITFAWCTHQSEALSDWVCHHGKHPAWMPAIAVIEAAEHLVGNAMTEADGWPCCRPPVAGIDGHPTIGMPPRIHARARRHLALP